MTEGEGDERSMTGGDSRSKAGGSRSRAGGSSGAFKDSESECGLKTVGDGRVCISMTEGGLAGDGSSCLSSKGFKSGESGSYSERVRKPSGGRLNIGWAFD